MSELAPNGKEKVVVQLVGFDSNAFSILGRVMRVMRRSRWSEEEITAFREQATSGDYNHLLTTVMDYCEEPPSEDEEDSEEDWPFETDGEEEDDD